MHFPAGRREVRPRLCAFAGGVKVLSLAHCSARAQATASILHTDSLGHFFFFFFEVQAYRGPHAPVVVCATRVQSAVRIDLRSLGGVCTYAYKLVIVPSILNRTLRFLLLVK